jgi:hypothetical protein
MQLLMFDLASLDLQAASWALGAGDVTRAARLVHRAFVLLGDRPKWRASRQAAWI